MPDYKEAQRKSWTDASSAWRQWHPRFSQMSRDVTEHILRKAQLAPGMRALDLAGGTGEPSLSVAQAVGPEGSVVMTDLVPEMVETARENAAKAGLTNMTFRQADIEQLPFDDEEFDRVTCRFGIMFVPDAVRGLREVHRVLKPGGRAAFTVWDAAALNPFFTDFNSVLMKHGLAQPPEPGAPNVFRFAEHGSVSAALKDGGFAQADERPETISWNWPGPVEESWEFVRSGSPWRANIEAIPSDKRDEIVGEIMANVRPRYDGTSVNYSAAIIVASGVK